MNDHRSHPLYGIEDLFRHILRHWVLIGAAGLLSAALAAAVSLLPGKRASVSAPGETAADEAAHTYDEMLAAIDLDIRSYQTALSEEQLYLDKSLQMQLDPFHTHTTTRIWEIQAEDGLHSISELEALSTAYRRSASSSAFLEEQAARFNTEPRLLNELISGGLSGYSGSEIPDPLTLLDTRVYPMTPDRGTCRFFIRICGSESAFTEDFMEAVSTYIESLHAEKSFAWFPHTLTRISAFSNEVVDPVLRSGQKAVADRIYNYTDKLVKIETARRSIETEYRSELNDQDASAESGTSLSPANLVKAFLAGVFLAQLLLLIRYSSSSVVRTGSDFRRRYPLAVLALREHPGGESSEEHCRKSAELAAASLRVHPGSCSSVLVTGTVPGDIVLTSANIFNDSLGSPECRVLPGPDFLGNPKTRSLLPETDAVILIEKRNLSRHADIEKELELLDDFNIQILGAVVL